MLLLCILLAISVATLLESAPERPPLNEYLIVEYKTNFFQAWRHCHHYGLQLASVNSEEDNQFMHKLLNGTDHNDDTTFWLAGTDIGLEGTWIWISTNRLVGQYVHWGGQSPQLDDAVNCMMIGSFPEDRTLWRADFCDKPHKFICRKSACLQ